MMVAHTAETKQDVKHHLPLIALWFPAETKKNMSRARRGGVKGEELKGFTEA